MPHTLPRDWRCGLVILLCGLATFTPARAEGERDTRSLDGVWRFRLDPGDVGVAEEWYRTSAIGPDIIRVPGSWDGQGFGPENDKLRSNHVGKAWYAKRARIPLAWTGKRVFLCFTGVHRYADTWVNGAALGTHVGYLSPFEYDVTGLIEPGGLAHIAVRVDSEQRWDIDCLSGAADLIDAMFTPWGGISGHVYLEARNDAWLTDLFAAPRVGPTGCRLSAGLAGRADADAVRFAVLGEGGEVLAESEAPVAGQASRAVDLALPDAPLWSPDTPNLLRARATLMRDGTAIDAVETRFGLREIETRGNRFYLNGSRLFLRGYGDDSVYPETIAPPTDKDVYLRRLRLAKSYGFNFVRHHSHFLPDEYYEACDEVGMLVQPELPNAYQFYWDRAQGPALDLYRTEWEAAVRRHRNHPSIFDWCMGNESQPFPSTAPELYRIARDLDPTRPIIDTDGIWGEVDRPTLEFVSRQFDEGSIPLDYPGRHALPEPALPVISHETSNYATFPHMDEISLFRHCPKPFWLTPARDRMAEMGLLGEADLWARNSERLALACHKMNIESLRKNPDISGYTWWLFQDYWTGSNGVVDAYYRPKFAREDITRFNQAIVLLEDGLRTTYRSGDLVETDLLISNMSPGPLASARVNWRLCVGGLARSGETVIRQAPAGELTRASALRVRLPHVGRPQALTLDVELLSEGRRYSNQWTAWVYPSGPSASADGLPVYAEAYLLGRLAPFGARPLPEPMPSDAVYVVSQPSPDLLEAVEDGARMVCLSPVVVFPSVPNRYKPAWWLGSPTDSNVGTVAYRHPLTEEIAPDGWCDPGWHRMLEGAQAYVLDDLPSKVDVIVRGVDVHTTCRSKALLWEARVGEGSIVVSGLELGLSRTGEAAPEREWMLGELVRYAAAGPRPSGRLPAAWLRERFAAAPVPTGPFTEGFARVLANDGEEGVWYSIRGDQEPLAAVRQDGMGKTLTWETAPAPDPLVSDVVTYIWAGGVGYASEPATEGFALLVGGEETLRFDITQEYATWTDASGDVRLTFVPKRVLPQDGIGLFYLSVPSRLVRPGQPLEVGVRSLDEGSRRWFGLNPYTDVAGPMAEAAAP